MQPKMDEAEPDLIYSLNPLWLQAMQGPSQWTVTGSVWPDCGWGGHQQEGEEGEERELTWAAGWHCPFGKTG